MARTGVRHGTVLAAGVVLAALTGCSTTSGATRDEGPDPGEDASAFDPLAFEEPAMPRVDGSAERRRDVERAVQYFADAWTYGLRTGYVQPFNAVCSSTSKGCREVRDEMAALSASGHHVEMDPIEVEVRRISRLRQHHFPGTRLVATIAPVVVEVSLPERVERDATNGEVDRQGAEDRRLGLVFVSEPAYHGWVVYRWYDPALAADAV